MYASFFAASLHQTLLSCTCTFAESGSGAIRGESQCNEMMLKERPPSLRVYGFGKACPLCYTKEIRTATGTAYVAWLGGVLILHLSNRTNPIIEYNHSSSAIDQDRI